MVLHRTLFSASIADIIDAIEVKNQDQINLRFNLMLSTFPRLIRNATVDLLPKLEKLCSDILHARTLLHDHFAECAVALLRTALADYEAATACDSPLPVHRRSESLTE